MVIFMAEKIYESTTKEDGKFKLECSSCYFENLLEDAEKDDVFECEDCGAPFTIVDVSDDKIQFKAVVFDEEEWRE
jgi:peptide subunit release factor 1 (eRF1)